MDRSVIRKPPIVLDGSCLDDPPPTTSTTNTAAAGDPHRQRRRYGIKAKWFTRPVHLDDAAGDPAVAALTAPVPCRQPPINGLVDALSSPSSSSSATAASRHPDHVDQLLRTYFPLTLMISGASPNQHAGRSRHDVNTASGETSSGSRSTSGRRRSRMSGGGHCSRPSSTRSSSSSTSNGSFDRVYLTSNDVSADILGIVVVII